MSIPNAAWQEPSLSSVWPNLLAVFISAKQCDTRASVTLAVRDQDTEGPLHVTRTAELLVTTSGMGYPKFISHQQLHSRPGYLAGDTLVIRAEVRVLL